MKCSIPQFAGVQLVKFKCEKCGAEFEAEDFPEKCPKCGKEDATFKLLGA